MSFNNNVIFTPQIFAQLVAFNLATELNVVRNLSTQYTKYFGNKTAQVGQSISAKKPYRAIPVSNNLTYSAQPLSQQKFTINVDQTSSVYYGWDTFESTFELEDINNNYAKPVAIALASDVNQRIAQYIALNTFNSVGTPGTNPTAMLSYLAAKSKLIRLGLPAGETSRLNYVISSAMSDTYIDANKALFNNQSVIGTQMKTGRVENTLGVQWETDETLYQHTTGAQGGTPLVAGAAQVTDDGNNGTFSLNIDGLPNSTLVYKAGDVFTLGAGSGSGPVYSVHPQTRKSTGDLQQFVLSADVTSNGSGLATLVGYPAITPANGSNQYANVSNAPGDNAPLTFWGGSGDANKTARQGLLIHPDSYAFMSVPFENPTASEGAMAARETDPETGISVSIIRAFDIDSRTWKTRFDTCFGIAPMYKELACRVQGAL